MHLILVNKYSLLRKFNNFFVVILLIILCILPFTNSDFTSFGATTESISNGVTPEYFRTGEERGYSEVLDSEVMYAIIAPESFQDTLKPLAEWKTYKGVPAKIYTLESIYANYSMGFDDAENIHTFLQDLDDTSPALTWLLLVGDSDIVPTRTLYANALPFGLDNSYASDYYYAGLDNDWDKDNDGVYGNGTPTSNPKFEGDWTPNVYVGRLPVANVTELNNSVNHILAYEQGIGLDDWMKKAVFWGGLMNAPNHETYNKEYTNAYKVKEFMVKPIFEAKAAQMEIFTRYDYSQLEGNNYNYNLDILHRTGAVGDFNAGCSILNFAGQAYYTGNAILHYNDPSGEKLINQSGSYAVLYYGKDGEVSTNGYKRPLVTAFTCGAGDFAEKGLYEDLSLERLLMAPNGGAIGVVGSTGKTHRGEVEKSDGNWWMDREFYEIFLNGTFQPGKCLYDMKQNYLNKVVGVIDYEKYKAMLYGYNYMGDPELNIWTDLPGNLDINISGLWLGPHNITVTVRDEYYNTIPNARVCLQNNEIYEYGVTNESGVAQIFVEPTQMVDLKVVVTAHNFLPFDYNFTIGIEPADLMITDKDIQFSIQSPSIDQKTTVNATVLNRGKTAFTGTAHIVFSLNAPVVEGGDRIGDEQIINGLAINEKKTVSVEWPTVPGNNVIYVQVDPENLIYESYKWNNLASKGIYVRRPELYILPEEIEFIPDTSIYIDDHVQIKVKIYNIGDSAANNVKVRFIHRTASVDEFVIGTDKIINQIPVNGNKIVTNTWTAMGGENQIKIVLDPENSIAEFNKTNNSASKNITVNYPPVLKPLRNIELDEDNILTNATELKYFLTDEDTSLLELNITLGSSDDNCVVKLNRFLGIDIYPALDWFGTSNITVNISDGGVSIFGTFLVTVNPVNDAPRIMGDNFSIFAQEDSKLIYQFEAYDPEGDKILYSIDTDLFDIDENTGEITFTPTQADADLGTMIFNLTASDGNLTSKQSYTLTILEVPDAPTIMPVTDQYAQVDEEFELHITAEDVDSSNIYYYDNTPLFTIDLETGIIKFKPKESQIGSYQIKITVTDETFLSANVTFKLTINASDKNDSKPDNNNDNGNDTVDNGFDLFTGLFIFIMILILPVIIIIIIAILLIKKRNRSKASDKSGTDKYFHDDYKRDKEYQDIYSTSPPKGKQTQTPKKQKTPKKPASKASKVDKKVELEDVTMVEDENDVEEVPEDSGIDWDVE